MESLILLIEAGVLIGYWAGYYWRSNSKPKKHHDFCALVLMPIAGLVFIIIAILIWAIK